MKIELPKKVIEPEYVDPRTLLIYSPPKTGKTTACLELTKKVNKENGYPLGLLIDLNNGAKYDSGVYYPVEGKNQLEQATTLHFLLSKIEKEGNPYKFLIVDGLSDLEDISEWHATRTYMNSKQGKKFNREETGKEKPFSKWESVLSLPNGSGYLHLRNTLSYWRERLAVAAKHVIFLGHVRDVILEKDSGVVSYRDLDLAGKNKSITTRNIDAISQMVIDGDDNEQRVLSFELQNDSDIGSSGRSKHLANQRILLSESTMKDGRVENINYHWDNIYTTVEELQ